MIRIFGDGPFDPSYGSYGEDIDYMLKLRRLGWSCLVEGSATADHFGSYATGTGVRSRSGLLRSQNIANRYRNVIRHDAHSPWLHLGLCFAEDLGFAATRLVRFDHQVLRDLGVSWQLVAGNFASDRRFRGPVSYTHLTLPTICSV